MKKSFFIAVLLILTLSCVFADGMSFTVQASPYSFQHVKYEEGFNSTYGFGAKLGINYNFWKSLTVGFDLKYSNYKYKELDSSYQIISAALANIGVNVPLGQRWYMNAVYGAGIQERIIGNVKAVVFGMNLYLGAGYKVSDKVALTIGGDFGLTFQRDSKDYCAEALLGAAILF